MQASRLARLIELNPRSMGWLDVISFISIAVVGGSNIQILRLLVETGSRREFRESSETQLYLTAAACFFILCAVCAVTSFQLQKLQQQHQLRAQPLFGASPRGLRRSWNAHRIVQGWFAYGPFAAFAVLLLPFGPDWFTRGSMAAALFALVLTVSLTAGAAQQTEAGRCRLAARAATLRSDIGDHNAAIEQLEAAHARLLGIFGHNSTIDAFTAAPMLARAYCAAGRQDSEAAKALLVEVEAAVVRNSRCCRWPADYMNWIDVMKGEDRLGTWLALRAHMTAAVQHQQGSSPIGDNAVAEQLNLAVSRGYRPSREEDTEQDYELALVDMKDPQFWQRVKTNHRRRKVKTVISLLVICVVAMAWWAIFSGLVLHCGQSKPAVTCSCSPGFTHDYLGPECEEICGCHEGRGCNACCQKEPASSSCRVDTGIYLNACGLDMHHTAPTWHGLEDCEKKHG